MLATRLAYLGSGGKKKRKEKEGETAGGAESARCVTCFGVDGEVGLAVQDAVHNPGAVAVGGVVGVRGRHLGHVSPCEGEEGRQRGSRLLSLR